jgi:hypothetical protein
LRHQEGCSGEGCWFPPDLFQEILWNDLVVNVPYNPLKDIGSVNIRLRENHRFRVYDDGIWVCCTGNDYYADRRTCDRRQPWPRRLGWVERFVEWMFARRSKTPTAL